MKRVYIVHGWGGSPSEPHISWIQKRAEEKGFSAVALEMPNSENPVIEKWVDALKSGVKNPDQNTYFIGHSIGGQAIMRYLMTLPEEIKVGGVIFLAGWFVLENLEDEKAEQIAKPWVETPINFESLRRRTGHYVAILSDNDPWVSLATNKELFEKNLSAQIIVEHNRGHYTEDDGVTEVLVVIEELVKISAAS